MHFKRSIQTIAVFLPVIFAGVIQRRDSAENVILVNCEDQNGGEISSRMAYYPGEVNATPETQAIVTTGHNQVWDGAPVSGTFPDGDTFDVNIPSPVGNGAYAGTARNQNSSFYCYRFYRPVTYNDNNVYCAGAYVCDHTAPSHDASKIKIDVSTSNQYVELTNLGQVSAQAVFNNVWQSRGQNTCQTDPIPMGDTCTIKFDCYGAIDWTTTNGMASTLVTVISAQNGIGSQWSEQVSSCARYCSTPTGSYCCDEQTQTVWHTKIIPSLEISVTNVDTNSLQGNLKYTIACKTAAPDCNLWDAIIGSLNDAQAITDTFAPEIASYLIAASAVLSPFAAGTC